MSSLAVVLTVFTLAYVPISQVLAQDFVKNALENYQRHQEAQREQQEKYQGKINDEDNGIVIDSIGARNLLSLLQVALTPDDEDGAVKRVDRKQNRGNKKLRPEKSYLDQLNELAASDIIVYDPDSYKPMRIENNKKKPPLVGLSDFTYDKAATDYLNEHSKVFVIQLEEDGNKKNQIEDGLNNVLSLLLKSAPSSQKDLSQKEESYKGFVVKHSRKSRPDLSERFDSRDDSDQKMQRRRRRGRTPIPYIRHRGDIFEGSL